MFYFLIFLLFLAGCGGGGEKYPLHENVTVTNFYVGERADSQNGYIPNTASAWDDIWLWDFGGVDFPDERNSTYPYYPAKFIPSENPFYFALPYNDLDENATPKPSQKLIPWYRGDTNTSILKNRWIKIIKNENGVKKTAYAQWEDVGPFESDDFDYVFGDKSPKNTINDSSGLDVSPAVKIYLGLKDIDKVSWRFVDQSEVPEGPWKKEVTTTPVTFKSIKPLSKSDSFYIQLRGELLDVNAGVYEVDMFDTNDSVIASLKPKKVICYINAGVWEERRSDAGDFNPEALGKSLNISEDERWLDIRREDVREIMLKRMDLAVEKGCDGVDFDNVNGYLNDTGFDLTYSDQFEYNRFLAISAKKRGLLAGLRNDSLQILDLRDYFDFSVAEKCLEYNECRLYLPFAEENKPVYDIEYNISEEYLKSACETYGGEIYFLLLPPELDGFIKSCNY